ncbi:uncharacterized protein LOC114879758 isoform X1 [Osmia bicornis bicornis]|uniref:uncharacterized protein LOC114879758 isoform X1 n=1 Tax=Osmia bicornis bicornis TaxID=1437191 RepID=UPI0010F7D0E4|nr:uncharacterized protein LOC114879758 isoform X1 [Osmia bicornis bicornis]
MRFHLDRGMILLIALALQAVSSNSDEPVPSIFDGIGNVANSATNLLTGIMQRQKEVIHRVTESASSLISNAVEKPRNLLINATRVTTGYIDSAASKGLEFKLRRIVEKFRARMPYGIPELDIPPMEPLQLDEVHINIDNPEIGMMSLIIEDLVVHNLSTFVTNEAKLSLLGPTIDLNLTVPKIYAEGYYNISGLLGGMVHLHGAGSFQANIYNFMLYVHTVLGYSRGVYLKTFDVDFWLTSMHVNLENFMGDKELANLMSKVFQDLTPKVVDIIKPDVLPGIRDDIGGRINETIHNLTMRDVITVLVGHNDIRDLVHLVP